MKKIISLIVIFALMTTIFLSNLTFAAELDTLTVDVDKALVRPGENVKLTVNFGTQLGAYTFNIAYDNNIFNYVSVEGGVANDTGDKVIVTFHDETGGTAPRENMSISFKAKDDITTSNPTELTVTASGLTNPDTTTDYEDITVGKVKSITVEPEYQDYALNIEYTGNIIYNNEKDMKVSYSSAMGRYYEHARLEAVATTPEGGNVTLTGLNTTSNAEQDIIQSGWGDPQGYKIGGKDVLQELNVKALFTKPGDYTITLKLIDRDNSDSVIAQKEFAFTALEKEPEITPPVEEKPEEKPQTKPTTLPKTGENIYVPMTALLIALTGVVVYYNKKNVK